MTETTEKIEKAEAALSALDIVLSGVGSPLEQKDNFKLMIYSDPGEGKTTWIAGIPKGLMLDSEDGNLVLTPEVMAPGFQRLPFKSFKQIEVLTDGFRTGDERLKAYETLVLDTVSTIHKDGLAEVKEAQYKQAPSLINRFKLETEDHTENNEHIRRLIRDFVRTTDRNLVLTAHARRVEPKDKPVKIFPDFSEKLANTIAGMMDCVGYLYTATIDGKEHKVLRVRPTDEVAAKTRITTMPDNIVDPTWEKLMGYVAEHKAKVAAGLVEDKPDATGLASLG